jgi:hypothetical protein
VHPGVARAASYAFVVALAGHVEAGPPVIVPCDGLPAPVAALGIKSALDAYAIAPAASVAVAASAGEDGRSVLWLSKAGDEPRTVKLAGRVVGLSILDNGTQAFVVVRATDRKGAVKNVDLMRVDVKTARATPALTLPSTARGLAIGAGGTILLVASRDEIRTFQLPNLSSGPLYRALGENVGVAPIEGSTEVVIAQPSRIVLADLAGQQSRDGLALREEAAAPARLTGMLTSTGDAGPIALGEQGTAWCVRVEAWPPPLPAPAAAAAPPEPEPAPGAVEAAPEAGAETAAEAAPEAAPEATPEVTPEAAPVAPIPAPTTPEAAGTVSGLVAGPGSSEVASIVFLGPDNVLHESARVAPDDRGRFRASALPTGVYRIVASGKGGRVLICEPPYITIRVGSDSAVEAPVLKVLRAK